MIARQLLVSAVLVGLAFSTPCFAAKSYTPAELRKMVNAGKYPKQGKPVSESRAMAFPACKSTAKSVIDQVRPNYPSEVIVDTGIMYMAKLWTNTGVVLMACSQLDGKLVTTTSDYL
jgi:predicted amino acid racemase